jgi:hypothetical protein
MVDGRDKGKPQVLDSKEPVSEALIVVYDIEVPDLFLQETMGAEPESVGFRKTPGRHSRPLEEIDPRAQLVELRDSKHILRIVKVEARELMERNVFVQMRIGRSGHDIHTVSEIPQGPAYPFYVDPLPSTGRVSTVGEQANPERLAVRSVSFVSRTNCHVHHTNRQTSGRSL